MTDDQLKLLMASNILGGMLARGDFILDGNDAQFWDALQVADRLFEASKPYIPKKPPEFG